MRENVRTFVKFATETLPLAEPAFEFGSYLVEDQKGLGDLRGLFAGKSYTGCDMRQGPGVDRVEDLASLTLPNGVAGTVLCLDTLEHVFEVRRAVDEIIRVLSPGGIVLIAVPLDFRIHEYPDDYWRLTPSCLMRLLEPLAGRVIGYQGVEHYPHTVFAIGMKAPIHAQMVAGISRFIGLYQQSLDEMLADLSFARRVRRCVNRFLRGKGRGLEERDYYQSHFVVDLPGNLALPRGAPSPARAGMHRV